jgi:electron transport complex protein RnfB
MHTVVTALCSGCDLCVPPCPVDCIDLNPATGAEAIWDPVRADAARERFERRNLRLERERAERAERLAQRALKAGRSDPQTRRAVIQAAIERARAKRAAVTPRNTDKLTTEVRAQSVDVDARRARQTLDDAKK